MEQPIALKVPHKKRVIRELDTLIKEWRAWKRKIETEIGGDPIDPFNPRPGRVHLDGEENLRYHRLLQERTLAFLDKNLVGHGFIFGRDGTHIDRTDLRLNIRVKHRLDDLDDIRARIEYAEVPPGVIKRGAAKIGKIMPDIVSNVITKLIQSGSSGS